MDNYHIQSDTIIFGKRFNKPLENYYSTISKCLKIRFVGGPKVMESCFNLPIIRLPNNIKSIEFNAYFNKPIHRLPRDLNHLIFGNYYNTPITLEKRISYLEFTYAFNQPLELTRNIKYLRVGLYFDNCVSLCPRFMHTLFFAHNNSQPIHNLPQYLRNLTLGYCNSHPVIVPESLESLTVNICLGNICIVDNLPHGLTQLYVHNGDKLSMNNLCLDNSCSR